MRITPVLAASAGLLASVLVVAAPAPAEIDVRDHGTFTYDDTFSDCGVDDIAVHGTIRSVFLARAVKDSDGEAWFGHNNYDVDETYTNRANGRSFSLQANGNWREISAEHLDGDQWRFAWKDSGATFVLRDATGTVLVRDRGTISGSTVWDLRGDGELGGDFVSEELVRLSGVFTEVRWCEDVVVPLLG